ncbi:sigma-70 family RNA polymerase sigma factor [Bradyrhizobium guangzhouense]|uniref:sigma-70 family RNA polymerase sigma factor n=1 Tax=Bradyrhizobium guangzhouense TaxID=1325095 RepID=UPI0024C0D809|nr:sigma-70 family RNA polymerase sigma factor [Bradyrhizobium guangzhouense]
MADDVTSNGAGAVRQTALQALERLAVEMRPQLHRYCARMTGSVIDGEDVLQDALLKAFEAAPRTGPLDNPEGWLFRIAHNATLDFLRRRARYNAAHADEDLDMIPALTSPVTERESVTASLATFMRLPVAQRSAVILRDVLGYSVDEVCSIMCGSVPATKGALQRGRVRLRELAAEPDDVRPPELETAERARLMHYVERFNARDFESLRDMLADDVRLEMVNRTRRAGRRDVSEYFGRYAETSPWHCVPGFVDRRPAIIMFDPQDPSGPPRYFVLLDWDNGSIVNIRDFLFAHYAIEGAELFTLD